MTHHRPDSRTPYEMQQFPLDEERADHLIFQVFISNYFRSLRIPKNYTSCYLTSLYSFARSWSKYGAVVLEDKDFIVWNNYDNGEMEVSRIPQAQEAAKM